MIKFEKTIKHAKILNPLRNFEETVLLFEYRADPLTKRNTTVIPGMLDYVGKFLSSDQALLKSLVEKTRVNCPFCPENVKEKTPMFPREFLREGRIFVGEAVAFPNLLGHAERSVLVVLLKRHHLKLNEFTAEQFFNGFKAGAAYLEKLNAVEPEIKFPAFIFNYLPPAGSSIFHPHMQVLARDRPFYLTELLINRSEEYWRENGSSFWSDLLAVEKGKERYLFETKGVEWLVPFAPQRGLNEVHAIIRGKSNLLELDDEEWRGLGEGLVKILKFYHAQGYVSFNAVLVSGPMDEHLEYFDVNLRVISRTGIQQWNFTDAWALPYLLWDGEAVEEPERLAEKIRSFLGTSR